MKKQTMLEILETELYGYFVTSKKGNIGIYSERLGYLMVPMTHPTRNSALVELKKVYYSY